MNRRKLLAIGGIGITSIAGCYGLEQAVLSSENSTGDGGSQQGDSDEADIGADQANTTDTPPEERDETDPESGANETASEGAEENETTGDNESTTSDETDETGEQNRVKTPDEDPTDAIDITEHQMVFEEAADPNYESDELYIEATIRNTNTHPLKNVRLEGYAYAAGEQVGTEHLEYAFLEGGGTREPEIPFFVNDPSSVDRYKLTVAAAKWA